MGWGQTPSGGWRYVMGKRKRMSYYINYGWQYKDINVRRPPLIIPRKGPGPKKAPKARNVIQRFNNDWQENRYITVKNVGLVEACQQRGIQVVKPEDLFTSHLPEDPEVHEEFETPEPLVKGPFKSEQEHPHFHERPAHCYDDITKFPQGQELDCAQVLLKTVRLGDGRLPERLVAASESLEIPDETRMVKQVLMESQVLDATQKLLPRNVRVPYIGWHPVEDRMFRKMPYDVTAMSWGRSVRREYGVPTARKNLNLTRGLLRACDTISDQRPSLLGRMHLEKTKVRQFMERGNDLIRFFVPIHHVVTAGKPLPPYADAQAVRATENMTLPNIEPLEPHCYMLPTNVYNDQINFPVQPLSSMSLAPPQAVHSGIVHYNSLNSHMRSDGDHASRSLVLSFLLALGQAKLLYGPEVSGELPAPIAVNFVSTDGQKFHFSAFQLNTLDLEHGEGVKNIFWSDNRVDKLYESCEYVNAVPTLQGYNAKVFKKFAALYLEDSASSANSDSGLSRKFSQ